MNINFWVILSFFGVMVLFDLQAATWTAEVTYPDKEVKSYFLTNSKHDFNLPNIKWKCSIGELKESNSCVNRWIECGKNKDFVSSVVTCCNKMPMNYSVLAVLENKISYLISLSCKN